MKILCALLFTAGIVLAGSDGGLFPWANISGAGMIAAVGIITNLYGPEA